MQKPKITLEALLKAAWRLHCEGALPAPKGTYVDEIVRAGGMRPWVREAIGAESATAMEAAGHGGWWLGAMMGRNFEHRRGVPFLDFDEGEADLLLAVDAACDFALSDAWTVAVSVRERIGARHAELAAFLDGMTDRVVRVGHRTARRGNAYARIPGRLVTGKVLREVARMVGLELPKVASRIVGATSVAKETARIVAVERPDHSTTPYRAGLPMPTYVLEVEDGHRWSHHDKYGALEHEWRYAYVGASVEVTLHGVMPGFRGYPQDVRTHGFARLTVDLRSDAATTERIPGSSDAEGGTLSMGDEVELLHGCLEARQHSVGGVVEVVGDMVLVSFEEGADPVPCYGRALRRLRVVA